MKRPTQVSPRPSKAVRSSGSERAPFRGVPLLIVLVLFGGVIVAGKLGRATRHLARTEWSSVPELNGVSVADLQLANGQTVGLAGGSRAHVVYLFQSDCATCDAQRAHVAALLEALPAEQVVSASAQAADAVQGYWSDLGSPLAVPVGADSAWLSARHLDHLPMILFVDRSGRVSKAIRGSLLSWSEQTLAKELASAGSS
jgi:hypothetical protein